MRKIISIALLIFTLSVLLRLWNLNMMGRVWDEASLMEKGYKIVELIRNTDFSNSYWYLEGADHPPFAFYFFGIASYGDLIKYDINAVPISTPHIKGAPIFHYDLTYGRMVSVIISSLAVIVVFFIGVRYFSLFSGITSSIILAMLPHFLGYSQLVELESWVMFSFTICVFSYLLYLETNRKPFLILTGILTGVCLAVKQPNILIIFFYFFTFIVWKKTTKRNENIFQHFIILGACSFLTFFIVYPMPWFHLSEYMSYTQGLWLQGGLIPELIFGKVMGARAFYYILAFFITTPFAILLLTSVGFKKALEKRNIWVYSTLVIWFSVPFLMSFFHHRQHMVRYIIEFYAPLSLLAAIGLEGFVLQFSKRKVILYSSLVFLFIYLMMILLNITPYYYDYYNELIGGTKNVYEKKLFYLGWWGEGMKKSGMYIAKHAHKNSTIGYILTPNNTLYKSPDLHYEQFNPSQIYDYVIINYYHIIRIRLDEDILKRNYFLVYTEKADGADLVHIYKRKEK